MMASPRASEPIAAPSAPPEPARTLPAAPAGLPVSNFLTGFDWMLAGGVLALGFLIVSFSVRNSDFWMHLATGRLIVGGQYHFGVDPFSYVGEDRTWVNHSWLFDAVLYLLYKAAAGPGVVVAKAAAMAISVGLLLLARKPGQSVWPGVVCAALALVASAPRLLLQPTCASLLFLAALMAMLIRLPKPAGSWRFPALVGGLFWLWANCDQWFFIGPAALALYTIGSFVRRTDGEDTGTLLKALAVGVVACMLNPHHIGVWALPPELLNGDVATALKGDAELGPMFRGAFSRGALDFGGERDNPANLYSLFALLVLGAAGFGLNTRGYSAGLGLVWAGGVGLAMANLRAVPFLAFAAAPIAAYNLAEWGRRLAAGPLTVRTAHYLSLSRVAGRGVTGLVGLILIALTYPGWLHPLAQQRRWQWDVDPNESIKRAAEQVAKWRTDGALPPDARLLNFQPDIANYVAWFAPGERTFFDHRFAFHSADAAEYAALRRALDPRMAGEEKFDFAAFLKRYGVTYAMTADTNRVRNQTILASLWTPPGPTADAEWELWHVAGRAVLLGWRPQMAMPAAQFDSLRFDPVRAAFRTSDPVPIAEVRPPRPERDFWEKLIAAPPAPAAEGEEAFTLLLYRQSLETRVSSQHAITMGLLNVQVFTTFQLAGPQIALTTWVVQVIRPLQPVKPADVSAAAILAVRAARRAIAASPDHPDGYYFLALAYEGSPFGNADTASLVVTANLGRCVARIPADPRALGGPTMAAFPIAMQLRLSHMSPQSKGLAPRIDLGLDATRVAATFLRADVEEFEAISGPVPEAMEKQYEDNKRQLDRLDKTIATADEQVRKMADQATNLGGQAATALERAAIDKQFGLFKEAIDKLTQAQEQFQRKGDYELEGGTGGGDPSETAMLLAVHADLVELLLVAGRAEEAVRALDTVDTPENRGVMASPAIQAAYGEAQRRAAARSRRPFTRNDVDLVGRYRGLRMMTSLVVGNFEAATEVLTRDAREARAGLARFVSENFPTRPPDLKSSASAAARQIDMIAGAFHPLAVVPAQLGGFGVVMHTNVQLNTYLALIRLQSDAHLRLAMIHLEQGDLAAAADHFKAVLNAPEGPALASQSLAREYLKLMGKN